MAIRQSPIPWTKYKKAARTLKTIYPGITPQQIIGRIGFPTKNGKRIRITSDGQGGIKERPLTAKANQERLRQKRRRIQTGKLSPEDATESRRIKNEKGDKEVDHFNELSFIGEQLEDLERRGGDVIVPPGPKQLGDSGPLEQSMAHYAGIRDDRTQQGYRATGTLRKKVFMPPPPKNPPDPRSLQNRSKLFCIKVGL